MPEYETRSSATPSTLVLPAPSIGHTPEMRIAMSKLNQISRDCGTGASPEENARKAEAEAQEAEQIANLTPYRRVEYTTAKSIKSLRDELRMLNSMESSSEYSKADCDKMRQNIRRHANDLGKSNKEVMRLARAEKCESDAQLLFGHMEKAKQAFRSKFHVGYAPSAQSDDDHSTPINSLNNFQDYGSNSGGGETQASLREDQEFQQFFQEVQQRDQIMDKQLDRIYNGLQRLNANAQDIKSELEMQERMIDDVTDRIDATTGRLVTLNKRLVKTIKELDSSRMCIYIFCCIVLVGLVGGILYETGVFKKV